MVVTKWIGANEWGSMYNLDTLGKGIIHILGRTERDTERFLQATPKDVCDLKPIGS
jgi:hypothetical protein